MQFSQTLVRIADSPSNNVKIIKIILVIQNIFNDPKAVLNLTPDDATSNIELLFECISNIVTAMNVYNPSLVIIYLNLDILG